MEMRQPWLTISEIQPRQISLKTFYWKKKMVVLAKLKLLNILQQVKTQPEVL